MSSGDRPGVALFCATYLEPEMHHVHRHVNSLREFRPVLLTQKRKGDWEGVRPVHIAKSKARELGRLSERLTGRPWQMTRSEVNSIFQVMERERCSVMHLFFGNAAIHMLPVLERSPVPVVVSFHGSDVAGAMAGEAYRKALKRLFLSAKLVPCRSEHLASQVAALGCPPEKLRVMRAVLPRLAHGKKVPPVDGAWAILQAGRMVPKKGMVSALRAFAGFHREFPGSTFTIAGEGPLRPALEALIGELGLTESVRLPGFLSQSQLSEEFDRAHLYLHPSETVDGDTEGVPNALLEAMARGLPPVATHHGGIPEAIESGQSGLLCAEQAPEELKAALLALAGDRSLYEAMSLAAARRVASVFSPEAGVSHVESLYREAMTG